jgi:hypothetical protein
VPVIVEGDYAERVANKLKGGMAVEVEGGIQGFDIVTANGVSKACVVLARRVGQVKE